MHAYIIHYLKKQMPYVVGKSEKQKKLLDRLDKEFVACARRYNLALGDDEHDVYDLVDVCMCVCVCICVG